MGKKNQKRLFLVSLGGFRRKNEDNEINTLLLQPYVLIEQEKRIYFDRTVSPAFPRLEGLTRISTR
jgi:hypothetical protein